MELHEFRVRFANEPLKVVDCVQGVAEELGFSCFPNQDLVISECHIRRGLKMSKFIGYDLKLVVLEEGHPALGDAEVQSESDLVFFGFHL